MTTGYKAHLPWGGPLGRNLRISLLAADGSCGTIRAVARLSVNLTYIYRVCRYATGGNLSEAVVLNVAEQMVKTGLRDAGYVFVRSSVF